MQVKARKAKEKVEFLFSLSNLRGESRLAEKEGIAAKKAARGSHKRIGRWIEKTFIEVLSGADASYVHHSSNVNCRGSTMNL